MDGGQSLSQMHEGKPERNVSSDEITLPSNWVDFVCTVENIKLVWEKLNEFPILFDDAWRGNFDVFLADMTNPNSLIFLCGDYGIARICNILLERDCEIHLAFWDRRFKGRRAECRQALKWLFQKLNLKRASIALPATVYTTISFTESIGFREEGVVRDAFMFKGRLLNLHLFGITRKEVLGEKEDGKEPDRKAN